MRKQFKIAKFLVPFIVSGFMLSGLILLGLIRAPLSSAEDTGKFISVNTAQLSINEKNIQKIKQEAVFNTLSAAVQGAIAKILPIQSLALNLEFLYQNILNKPLEYIITYRVVKSIQNEDKLLIAVESTVNINLLKKKLAKAKIMYAEKEKPVIVFFIYEQTPLEKFPRYWWDGKPEPYQSETEKIIIDEMLRNQFLVIGNDLQGLPDPSFYNIVFSSVNDVSAAISLGRKMKADIIIMGKAVSSETANRMGEERSFNAKIDLTAYDVKTNERAFVYEIRAGTTGREENGHARALAGAATQSADDLIAKLDAYWNRYLRKQQNFDLRVSGNIFLPRFITFKQRLDEIQGVETVMQKEAGTSNALLEIRYKGSTDQFANAVMLKSFDTFGVEIIEVTENSIDIRLTDKGGGIQ